MSPQMLLSGLGSLVIVLASPMAKADENLLANPTLEGEAESWNIHFAAGTLEMTEDGPDGTRALTLTAPSEGVERPSFYQDTDFAQTEKYRVSFFARADRPVSVLAGPIQSGGDYHSIGDGASASLESEWKEYHLVLRIREATSQGRLNFLLLDPLPAGRIQFANIRMEAIIE